VSALNNESVGLLDVVRFAEKNSWYISQLFELLQNHGDSMSVTWSQQLVDVIKYGQLNLSEFLTNVCWISLSALTWSDGKHFFQHCISKFSDK